MRIVAIVQARIASTRLPAKILLDLCGRTALERCLSRVQRIRHVDEVVLAIPDTDIDKMLAHTATRLGLRSIAGSEAIRKVWSINTNGLKNRV